MNTDMKQYLIFRLCIGMLINYWRASEASETLLVVVQWKKRYVYTYIYICIYRYVRHTFCSMVLGCRNVGGVKCQPFLKHSNHWKRALKMISREAGASSFLTLSLLLQ